MNVYFLSVPHTPGGGLNRKHSVLSARRPTTGARCHPWCHLAPACSQVQGEDDWMTKYFFSGGTMPSIELMLMFQDDLAAQKQW